MSINNVKKCKIRHLKSVIRQIALSMWMIGGFGILTRGKRATRKEAPILVCAPHSSFFDALVIYIGQMGSPLARIEEQRFGSKFSRACLSVMCAFCCCIFHLLAVLFYLFLIWFLIFCHHHTPLGMSKKNVIICSDQLFRFATFFFLHN